MRRLLVALTAAVLVLAAAGCSDSSGGETGAAADDSTPPADAPAGAAASEPSDRPAIPSAGCGTAASADAAAGLSERTITVDGVTRPYAETVPTAQDGEVPVPLLLALHGLGQPYATMATLSGFDEKAENEGFVAVYPSGYPAGDLPRWDVTPPESDDEVAYLRALIDEVGGELCIDEARIYVTGMSYGGMMTSRVICDIADVVAAGATVARTIDFGPCPNDRPVPLMAFHGTADDVLPYDGGIGSELGAFGIQEGPVPGTPLGPSVPESVAGIAERNGCDPEPAEEQVSDNVSVETYGGCTDGAEVVFYTLEGAGHIWPGSEGFTLPEDIVGEASNEISASDLMWDFFLAHPMPEE